MRTAALTCLTIFALASAASAQLSAPTGSRILKPEFELDQRSAGEVRSISSSFGTCVVKRHPIDSRRYVLETAEPSFDPESRECRKLRAAVSDGDCLIQAMRAVTGVKMTLPGDMLGFAFSDALFRAELYDSPIYTTFSNVPPLAYRELKPTDIRLSPGEKSTPAKLAELESRKTRALGRIYLAQFGECAVRADPQAARNLLRTMPGSAEEAAQLAPLRPALNGCVDADRIMKLNWLNLRGTIATNYYRLVRVPRSTAVASGAPR